MSDQHNPEPQKKPDILGMATLKTAWKSASFFRKVLWIAAGIFLLPFLVGAIAITVKAGVQGLSDFGVILIACAVFAAVIGVVGGALMLIFRK
jgi:hypothetical protein